MTNKEVYEIWSPFAKKWVDWVRPVPFIAIDESIKVPSLSIDTIMDLTNIGIDNKNTAIIIDLPHYQSIELGIQIAKEYGYRPIPIYNGVVQQKNSRATTDNISISGALIWGAQQLKSIEIKDDASPVFLTDTNRLQRHRLNTSIFDNSWDVYHQDLPTEDYFLTNGITKILVISDNLSKDLKRIFDQYPKKHLSIFWTNGYEKTKCIRRGKLK